MKQEYQVKLDLFEGPLDLLLYLVTKSEVNIVDISVAEITNQYLSYLDLMKELNIDVASEYLHMAATLVRLKSNELLPQPEHPRVAEEEGIYNRDELIRQLLEYKKYKEAADSLRTYESHLAGSFARGKQEPVDARAAEDEQLVPGAISIFDLLSAFRSVLQKAQEEGPSHVVKVEPLLVDDRIEHILSVLTDRPEVRFDELFSDDMRRIALVVTFMAMLELIKMQMVRFRQEQQYGGIFVSRRAEEDREKPVDMEQPNL